MSGVRDPKICAECNERIEGQFVRALGGHYHLDCFRCKDCNQVVAEKFFPLKNGDNIPQMYCEKDYFRRLDLLCAKCGGALRGPHINALNKKYHLEHFTCSVCPTVFRQHDSYYERDGQVYCQYHYSILYAAKCGGCQTAVLKNFVEFNKENLVEQWHPECYMIYKLWNVKLAGKHFIPPADQVTDTEAEVKRQQITVEKVGKILHILSAFEESSAECISDMLIQFSAQHYEDGIMQAGKFIYHIEALFSGIDEIEAQLATFNDRTGLHHTKEPKQLAKRIVHFFSLLSHTRESSARKEATKEMISLVTSLAHTLKILIRAALTGALKLERNHSNDTAVDEFLERLGSLSDREAEHRLAEYGPDVKTDLCAVCRKSVEDECLKLDNQRWHGVCFKCSVCDLELKGSFQEAGVDGDVKVYCPEHTPGDGRKGVEKVTQLEQYTFLLRCALKRLCILLDVRLVDGRPAVSSSSSTEKLNQSQESVADLAEDADQPDGPPSKPASETDQPEVVHVPESADTNGVQSNDAARDLSVSYGTTTLPRIARPAEIANTSLTSNRYENEDDLKGANGKVKTLGDSGVPASSAGSGAVGTAYEHGTGRFLSELSGLEHLAVRQLAALAMHPLVERYYSLDELMSFVEMRKRSMWSKVVGAIKKPPKTKAEGTFGVPLEILVERYGVESELGPGSSSTRIPIMVDACIRTLRKMDLTIEGIFRKNGNIKKLKTQSDDLDRDPRGVDLDGDNPIQVAALLKKFLREMPEPLLTFKLHRLFITSQKLPEEKDRRKVLHYVCCLLPKPNLDVLMVLAWFLREVSEHSGSGAHTDDGNKMDLDNLATVITPNILYSKSKNPADDESVLAIEAVRMLLKNQTELWLVPEDVNKALNAEIDINNVNNLPVPELLRRYERATRMPSFETMAPIRTFLAAAFAGLLGVASAEFPLDPSLISLRSKQGQRLVLDTLPENKDYFPIQIYSEAQIEALFGGPASVAAVLNALNVTRPAQAGFAAGLDLFTQVSFFNNSKVAAAVDLNKTRTRGDTLNELWTYSKAWTDQVGAEVKKVHASETNVRQFRDVVRKNINTAGDAIIVNYWRGAIGQINATHISPIAAYHEHTDRILIMETNLGRYPPVWVKTQTLFNAMNTIDVNSNVTRGYLEFAVRKAPATTTKRSTATKRKHRD
ncbi:hypothetical protein HK097_004615 [Rhizophlyctis rosea]|uniref:glutathione gamma-glutamylcysteinyltransferase n=1 Tax=Rhizophlyctis rosea TaxID=64517 RepID=A0AAD5SL34_9FUNG|nr:hypothetical protein HK097_004615 [Rhizophlyctis rosea]